MELRKICVTVVTIRMMGQFNEVVELGLKFHSSAAAGVWRYVYV